MVGIRGPGLAFEFDAKVTRLEQKFARVEAAAAKMEKKLDQTAGKAGTAGAKISKAFDKAASAAAMGAVVIAAGMTKATVTFAKFEKQMVRVGAITNTLGSKTFDDLQKSARGLAKTTEFSASQVGDAMGFMAQAGFDANKIMAGTPRVLELASAAMMDVAQAADITTNVMSGYGLGTEDLARANDVLVAAMTSANTNLTQLGEAFKYAGPVAKGAGIAFEESAAALAMMGNAGIQASMAGTSLRGAVSRLLAPSKEVAAIMEKFGLSAEISNGKIKSFTGIIRRLQLQGASTGEMMELFGLRAGPAMAALVEQGADSLEKLNDKLKDSEGIAGRIAEAQLDTLAGQWKIFKSNVEEVEIALGSLVENDQVLPWLSSLTSALGDFIKQAPSLGSILERMFIGLAATVIDLTKTMYDFLRPVLIVATFGMSEIALKEVEYVESALMNYVNRMENRVQDTSFNMMAGVSSDSGTKPFFETFPAGGTSGEASKQSKAQKKAAERLAKAREKFADEIESLTASVQLGTATLKDALVGKVVSISQGFTEGMEKLAKQVLEAQEGIDSYNTAIDLLSAKTRNEALKELRDLDSISDIVKFTNTLEESFGELADSGKITEQQFRRVTAAVKEEADQKIRMLREGNTFQQIGGAGGPLIGGRSVGGISSDQEIRIRRREFDKMIKSLGEEEAKALRDHKVQSGMAALGSIMGGNFQDAAFSIASMTSIGQSMGSGFLSIASGLVDLFVKGVQDTFAAVMTFVGMGTDFVANMAAGSQRAGAFLSAAQGGMSGIGAGAGSGAMLGGVGGSLLGAVLGGPLAPLTGVAGGVLGSGLGGVAGGGVGGITGFLAPILSLTKKFEDLGKAFEAALGPAIDALEPLTYSAMALAPPMGVLAEAVARIAVRLFQSAGGMELFWMALTSTAQVTIRLGQIFVEALEWFSRIGWAIAQVNEGLWQFRLSLAEFAAMFGIGLGDQAALQAGLDTASAHAQAAEQNVRTLETFGGALDDLANGLATSFEEAMTQGEALADSMGDVDEAAKDAAGSMFNVPVGFKINSARMAAIDTGISAGVAGNIGGGGPRDEAGNLLPGSSSPGGLYIETVIVEGVKDLESLANEIQVASEVAGLQHDGKHQNGLYNARGGGLGSAF